MKKYVQILVASSHACAVVKATGKETEDAKEKLDETSFGSRPMSEQR